MVHNTVSEHEMTEPAPDSMITSLLSSEESDKSRAYNILSRPKIHDFLRLSRLQILGKIFGLFSGWRHEPRKVAIHRSRQVAAFHCLLHLIPLGGAITLLVLRWTHYWIGHDPPFATTLQFVAKFHELLMQVSIVEISLCIVRYEATQGFVPLGALSGAIQATRLSYLWSLDFLSLLTSNTFRGRIWPKVGIVLAIPVLLILTALVGPSSAVLMIPEPGCSKLMDPVAIFMTPNESLYPAHLNHSNGLNTDFANIKSTIQRFQEEINIQGLYTDLGLGDDVAYPVPSHYDRVLRLSMRGSEMKTTLSSGHQVEWYAEEATSVEPTGFAASALLAWSGYGDKLRANETHSISLPNPVTRVKCFCPTYEITDGDEVYYVMKDGTSLGVLGNISSLTHRVKSSGVFSDEKNPADDSRFQHFDPIWLDSPEPHSPVSIAILLSWMTNATELQPLDRLLAKANQLEKLYSLVFKTCSVSAYWNTMQASLTWDKGRLMPADTRLISELELRDERSITMDTTGTHMLNDPNFAKILEDGPSPGLAVAFGLTISNIPSYDIPGYNHELSDLHRKQWGYDSRTSNNTFKVAERQAVLYAYGYTTDSISVRLSLTVILAYCIITVAYLVYILITGSTSTAWNSAIELVALALQSRKPDYPGRTAVGIDSLDTFNQGVGIRVNSDNELELVFASDRDVDKRGLRKIEKNVAY